MHPVLMAALTAATATHFDASQLKPYLPDGALAAARARYDAGLYADAFLQFRKVGELPPQAAYLEGLSALQSDRPAEAAKIFADLLPAYPVLADRIAYNLGLAQERLGDIAAAADAYARVGDESVLADDARLLRSRLLRQSKALAEALACVAPLVTRPGPKLGYGRDVGSEALFLSAEIDEAMGRRGDAARSYLDVWASHPMGQLAEDALERAAKLKEKPTLKDRVTHAIVILDANRNAEGTHQIEEVLGQLTLPDPLACQARYALGRGYRKLRQHQKAIETLEPVARGCTDPDLLPRVLYTLGSSTSIVQPERGVQVYAQLARDFPGHSYADDALFYEADLLQKQGDVEGARKALTTIVEHYGQGDYFADALFRLFWLDRHDARLAEGLLWLDRLELEEPATPDAERAMYWSARTLEQLDRNIEALATYESLVRRHPTGYYAMLARGRLTTLDPLLNEDIEADIPAPPGEIPALELDATSLLPDQHFLEGVELFRLGLVRSAADELWAVDRKAAVARAGSPEPSLLVAWLLDQSGARQAAHEIARTDLSTLLRGRPEAKEAVPFRIAYPQAYRDLVERWGHSFGVPPDLLQGLMREESSLDPDVVSWAGAVGLTQLMPATARMMARSLRLGRVTAHQLRDPDLNVRLGAAYLGKLLKKWKGNPALAAASYNAGEGAVQRWLDQAGSEEIDAFVEEIPIEETRNYVRRVLTSYSAYRITYGSDEGAAKEIARLMVLGG